MRSDGPLGQMSSQRMSRQRVQEDAEESKGNGDAAAGYGQHYESQDVSKTPKPNRYSTIKPVQKVIINKVKVKSKHSDQETDPASSASSISESSR